MRLGDIYRAERWGIILAGGNGTRLLPLTRRISGDDRPKQFCPILGSETLLEQTGRRLALTVAADRTLVVLAQAHERFYAPLLAQVPASRAVVQPENRGTAPAILYGLLCLAAIAPTRRVAILPSDHYVSDDAAFMAHVGAAFDAVRALPEVVVLLGITPESPEVEYGWIEPGPPIAIQGACPLYRVRRFWEKPPQPLAETLMAQGCLWNSFVMVGRVSAFLTLIRKAMPQLYYAFGAVHRALGTPRQGEVARQLYARLPETNFSHEVLASRPEHLALMPAGDVGWSDWGKPSRVLSSLARIGVRG